MKEEEVRRDRNMVMFGKDRVRAAPAIARVAPDRGWQMARSQGDVIRWRVEIRKQRKRRKERRKEERKGTYLLTSVTQFPSAD